MAIDLTLLPDKPKTVYSPATTQKTRLTGVNFDLLPDKPEKSVINFDLLPDKREIAPKESSLKRYGKGVLAGLISVPEGIARSAEAFIPKPFLGKYLAKWIAGKAKTLRESNQPPDPKFFDMLASGVGSMAGFLIPGVGISRSVQTAKLVPKLANWIGASASGTLEAMTEGGFAYERAKEKKMTEAQAVGAATKTFWLNLPTVVFTNKLGIFGDKGGIIRKMISSSPIEALQEFTQQVVGNISVKDPTFQGAKESALIGGILGGVAGGVTHPFMQVPQEKQIEGVEPSGKPGEIAIPGILNAPAQKAIPIKTALEASPESILREMPISPKAEEIVQLESIPQGKQGIVEQFSESDKADIKNLMDWEQYQPEGKRTSYIDAEGQRQFTGIPSGHSKTMQEIGPKESFELLEKAQADEKLTLKQAEKVQLLLLDFRENIKTQLESTLKEINDVRSELPATPSAEEIRQAIEEESQITEYDWEGNPIASRAGQEEQSIISPPVKFPEPLKTIREEPEAAPYAPQYSVSEEEYGNVLQGGGVGVSQPGGKGGAVPSRIVIPPSTATQESIEWEKSVPWQVNLGRNITGIFEREIGPRLQISKRMKKWLGVYYPMLGPNGTIRVVDPAHEQTLNHETAHFLDDVLGKFPIEKRGDIRGELIKTTKFLRPFEESYETIIDKETGLPKMGKKGKILKKQSAYTAYRRSRAELFADYVSLYASNPDKARELAPKFTEIVEKEIARDKEFAYVVAKLREFETAFKPVKDFVDSLRKIPEIAPLIRDWENKGTIFYNIWTKPFGELLYNKLVKEPFDAFSKMPLIRELAEKKGLSDKVFEIFRQHKKLIDGQRLRLKEEFIDPLSKLDKDSSKYIAESLQRWESMMEDSPFKFLREEARKEFAVWGNEARKLGLLNDGTFWNNVGQYFPFMYTTKEFEGNKIKHGFFPSKQIRANMSAFKHRMTDAEMGKEYYKALWGTWPSSLQKINAIPVETLIIRGRQVREELGLMKESAAYVMQKRVSQMIEVVYTVKAFNQIAKIPGIIGGKGFPGYAQMPEGKKFGDLSGQWVPENVVKEVAMFNQQSSELGRVLGYITSVWKAFKVVYDVAGFSRNIVTNGIMAYLHDVPIWDPRVLAKGISAAVAKNEAYKNLRDNGLLRHTYNQTELQDLANLIKEDPQSAWQHVYSAGIRLYKKPGDFYGFIEDVSKISIANWAMEQGADVTQAVKFADKILFDYSSVSSLVGKLRKGPFPMLTWSAKVLPRLIETAIKHPEKYIFLISLILLWNERSRRQLGITAEEEERLKPKHLRGQATLLSGKRDVNGDLNYIDLTYFLPWGGWMPVRKGKLALPQTSIISNPLMSFYNAYVLNYDPFYGEIAKEYMTEEEADKAKKIYLIKSLGPRHLTQTPFPIIKSIRGVPDRLGRKSELGKILAGEFLGIRYTPDTSAARGIIRRKIIKDHQSRIYQYNAQHKTGEITREKREELIRKSVDYMRLELKNN